ncbi:MAG: serine hydrolase domain-containing protein [Pseudomonadota bacterium]
MRSITRRMTLGGLVGVFGVGIASRSHADATWRKTGFSALAEIARTRVDEGDAVGLAVGMSAPGFRKSAYYGHERVGSEALISTSTQFRIASVTKPITAAAVLDLAEREELSLDGSIDQFFPEFPRAEEISVRQLLAHTSGLANWWGRLPADVPADFMDRSEPHRALASMRDAFLFEPGTMRSYSNSGYVLLGEIIEKVAGTKYEDWVNGALLSRCGASGMILERTGDMGSNWATGYYPSGEPVTETPMPFAAGGYRSNLHDILAFSDALFHGQLLSSSSLSDMVTQARVNDGRLVQDAMYDASDAPAEAWPQNTTEFGYGLGINTWVQSGERFYSHSGLIDGFSAYLIHAPRTQTTVAVLSNSQNGTAGFGQAIRDLLIAA